MGVSQCHIVRSRRWRSNLLFGLWLLCCARNDWLCWLLRTPLNAPV